MRRQALRIGLGFLDRSDDTHRRLLFLQVATRFPLHGVWARRRPIQLPFMVFLIHARQDGHAKRPRPIGSHRPPCTDGLHCCFEHGPLPPRRVHVERSCHSGHRRRGKQRAPATVLGMSWNFQIEKNPSAQCRDLFYGGQARGGKELVADLTCQSMATCFANFTCAG